MRRTKEDAELTRQALLDAALTVFSREGYAATRLEDVAAAAGVTRGAIYHHFGSKSELFAGLIDDASQAGSRAAAEAIDAGGSSIEIVRRVLVFTLRLLRDDARFRGAMGLLLFNSGDSPELAALRSLRARQGLEEIRQIAGFFQMGREQGAVRPDLDPEVAARAFLAYQNGLVLMALSAPDAFDAERQVEALADTFVRGIVISAGS